MNYTCSFKCISLATATLLLNSHNIKADVRGNLDDANAAFRALDSNPENWQEVAQSFINVFNEFSNGIATVLDEHGAKFDEPFISVSLWKKGKLRPESDFFYHPSYLKQETIDAMPTCGPSCWHEFCWGTEDTCNCCAFNPITDLIMAPLTCCMWPLLHCILGCIDQDCYVDGAKGDPIYYFIDNVEGPLKKHICQALRVSSIKQAGFYWEEKFVKPVSRLLINHAEEMKQDAEILQLLLNLLWSYMCCEFPPYSVRPNDEEVAQVFFDSLVETIVTCNTPGEMENILCGLLLKKEGKTKIGDKYYKSCGEYNISIKFLVERICVQAAVQATASENSTQTSEAILRSIQVAMSIVKEIGAN